jgi:glycosyltransferase involved in cell wall biosynthesis
MTGQPLDNPVVVPPGWPVTDRPLRVAMLGWARLSFQGTQGSGYNLSASELAAGLTLSGHTVVYMASGRRYSLGPGMHIKRLERWRGVQCFDLYNSPNLSPAAYNFVNLRTETHHAAQNAMILRWLEEQRVQVVHIHSLEGYPLSLIGAIRDSGRAVIVTPHNYWFVCPQVDLMRGETSLCRDYQGGKACESCIRIRIPWKTTLKRRLGHSFERIVGLDAAGFLRRSGKSLSEHLDTLRGRRAALIPNDRQADPESALGLEIDGDGSGLIQHNLAPEPTDNLRKPVAPTEPDENEQFLGADHHLTVLNHYGQRRINGIAALNRASLVTPPSDFVRRVYVKMGLDGSRSRVVRLGQPHFDQINRRARRSPFYDKRPWSPWTAARPLRFAFLGAMRPSKGIDVFAAAIPLLPREVRQRSQFYIRAQGMDWPLRKKLVLYPEVSFSGVYDLTQLIGAAGDYDVGVLPHVWFENSPLVLLEHLHAGKFVLCSRLGGPVEWVEPPKNGLLLPGGHPEDLAEAIARLVKGQVTIPSPREIHEATPILQSYPGHIREVESVYREALGEKPEPLPAPEVVVTASQPMAAAPRPSPAPSAR